jgi:hypothetical protein
MYIYFGFAIDSDVFGLSDFDVTCKAKRAEFIATIFQTMNKANSSCF